MKQQKPTVIMLDESVHQHGKCGDVTCPCASDPELPAAPSLLINGKPASTGEYKRLMSAAAPASNPTELSTKHIETVARGFRLMK